MSNKEFDAEKAFNKMFKYMVDMDKRLSGEIISVDKRLSAKMVEHDKEFERTNDSFIKMYAHIEKQTKVNDEKFEIVMKRFDQIQNTLDSLAGEYRTMVAEEAASAHAVVRIDDTLEDHETRIGQLENLELNEQAA